MRVAALIALLPALATLATAAPHHSHDHNPKVRKSLSFGPDHKHASFESYPDAPIHSFGAPSDPRSAATAFIAAKIGGAEGESFYIRDDTYTDSKTLVTHVFARQIINGLEVGDGDINVNIDRDGRVLSWGSSFHPEGEAPLTNNAVDETQRTCAVLLDTMETHKDELYAGAPSSSPWTIVKAAAQSILGMTSDDEPNMDGHEAQAVIKNMAHVQNHLDSICSRQSSPKAKDEWLSAPEALASLLSRISPSFVNPTGLTETVEHQAKPKKAPAEPATTILSGDALKAADVLKDVPARLMYTQSSEGAPRLVYKFEVEMKDNWYEAYVDVVTGNILRIVDWASDSSDHHHEFRQKLKGKKDKQKPFPKPPKNPDYEYHVFPWGVNDPTTGKIAIETNPADKVASPLGWHTFPTSANPWPEAKFPGATKNGKETSVASTVGNNVLAHEDWEGRNNFLYNHRPVNESFSFVYDYGESKGLAPKQYVDMAITQLFYTCNKYHDLLHRVGFDEAAGNFQMHNFDKGGRGGDPVLANAQDGSGFNNANFMTPPDGQAPRMRMYVWDTASPYRDGDLEAGIVVHEYSHGLSTRLTGGPANSGCLGWGEAGGMGEGWGDAIATLIRQVEEHHLFKNGSDVYPMGAWAANQETGIRNFVYSTNSTDNPSTYKTLDKPGYWGVHAIGEVWAEILFVVNQRLIEKYGFSKTLFPPEDTSKPNDYYTKTLEESVDAQGRPTPLIPKHGNTLILQLIVSGMKLQPCRPSFFNARDAIIQADQVLTGGENACIIWEAFAERGLGHDAEIVGGTPWGGGVRKDGFKVPPRTCK